MELTEDMLNSIKSTVRVMEWELLASTLGHAIKEIFGKMATPAPPAPSAPPPVPAGLGELNTIPQPAESQDGVYGGCIPQGAAPQMMAPVIKLESWHQEDITQPGPVYSQPGAWSQGQDLPYQWPVADAQTSAAVNYPAAPQHPYNNAPVGRFHNGFSQNLHPVEMLNNGGQSYELPVDPLPSFRVCSNTKKKHVKKHKDNQPYIKKPPNAFMLFLKEQRSQFVGESSAAVNKALGLTWRSMSAEEQGKYYEEANREEQLHSLAHPGWSIKDNYGKKIRGVRTRSKVPKPDMDTWQAKTEYVTPVQTAMFKPSHWLTAVTEPPHPQSARQPLTASQSVVVPTASTWLASPVAESREDIRGQMSPGDYVDLTHI